MISSATIAASCLILPTTLVAASTIRDVDFRNWNYQWPSSTQGVPSSWTWLGEGARADVRLVNGTYRFGHGDLPISDYLSLHTVTYGDLTGDGQDEAAVDLMYGTGGTANWHYLYVYTLAGNSPRLLGVLRSGSRADGGLVNVGIARGLLVLDFQDQDRREGDCCSRGLVRVRYRLQNGRFVEFGEREKDSLRVVIYPPLPKSGPQTVRQKLDGHGVNIVYTDADGTDKYLTVTGVNTQPDLSRDEKSVVFLREPKDKKREIWVVRTDGSGARPLYAGAVEWNGTRCPSSTFRSPQWSSDGHVVYFVTDCTSTTGALWKLDVVSGSIKPLIADAVLYSVIRTGRFRGYLISNRRSLPTLNGGGEPRYPVYSFFLFSPDGKLVQKVGEEDDDLGQLVAKWEGR